MRWGMRFAVMGAVVLGMVGAAQAQKGVAFERAEHLRRGVNLSSFYAQTRDLSQARLDAYMSAADMQALKAMGFDHVRLSINPAFADREPEDGDAAAGGDGATGQDGGAIAGCGAECDAGHPRGGGLEGGADAWRRRRGEFVRVLVNNLRHTMRRAIRSGCSSRF